jgi:Flp pilus assembly protein TadG
MMVVTESARTWYGRMRQRIGCLRARMHAKRTAGSAAVEFAFLAPVMFVFLMGTLEVGIMFLGEFALQNATNDAARQIRTGQVQLSNMTQAQFRQLICNEIAPVLQCSANLQIDVQTFQNFASASFSSPMQPDHTLNPALNNWAPGSVCSIVLVRTFYTWRVVTPVLTPFMVNMAGNYHLLYGTAAFRNEPYTTQVAGC